MTGNSVMTSRLRRLVARRWLRRGRRSREPDARRPSGSSGAARIATASRRKPGCCRTGRRPVRRRRGATAGVGNGYSSFSSSGGRLYTLGARGGNEYVIALDRATGKKVWETLNGRRYENDRGDGPRSTPTVDGDRLYVLGGSGDLTCLEHATGKKIWSINLVQKFGGVNPYWGYSESPLIVGDRILVNAGGRRASIVAVVEGRRLDAVAAAQRRRRLFVADADAHRQPQPGDLLHRVAHAGGRSARRAAAVVLQQGDQRHREHRHADRARHARVRVVGLRHRRARCSTCARPATSPPPTRSTSRATCATTTPVSVLVGDHLYGFSSSILTALKFDTGAMAWRDRSVGKGSLIFADNRLYLYSEDGVVGLAEASPAGYREHGRFTLAQQSGLPTWSHPIIAGGLLIIRDQDAVYAYNVRAK